MFIQSKKELNIYSRTHPQMNLISSYLSKIRLVCRSTFRNDGLIAYLFLAPAAITFALWYYYPLLFNLYISFHEWSMVSPTKHFIGFDNFKNIFFSDGFWKAFSNTGIYAIGTVCGTMLFGLILALFFCKKFIGSTFYKALVFSPYVTPLSAMSLLWLWIFDPQFGLVNILLRTLNINGPGWLHSPIWALPALIIMILWKHIGFDMIIFLAALQDVPAELYETGTIDGTNPWQRFRYITLPLLTPTVFFLTVTGIISSFQVFEVVQIMTQGGPSDSTKVLVYLIYERGFKFFEAGYASALAMILFSIVISITILQQILSKHWVYYNN